MAKTRSAKGKPVKRKKNALSSRLQQGKAVRQSYPKEALEAAIAEARQPNHQSLKAIAKSHGVPSSTLHRHLTGQTSCTHIGRRPYLSKEVEDQIAGKMQMWHERGYSVQKTQLAAFVFYTAHKLQPDSSMVKGWESKGVSAKWTRGFLKRHPNISVAVVKDRDKAQPADYKEFYYDLVAQLHGASAEEHSNSSLQAQLDDSALKLGSQPRLHVQPLSGHQYLLGDMQ